MIRKEDALEQSITYKSYTTVVVGAGPIGLLAAATAATHCKAGEKVAILADRKEELGIRNQVLWYQEDVHEFLVKIAGEEVILDYMGKMLITEDEVNGYYITTGSFEQLFFNLIDTQPMRVKIDLIQTEKIPANADITQHIQINETSKTITVVKKTKERICLQFKYLIAAEGTKRSVSKALAEEAKKEAKSPMPVRKNSSSKDIGFHQTQEPIHHTKHIVASFQLPQGMEPRTCNRLKVKPKENGPDIVFPGDEVKEESAITPRSLAHLRSAYGWTEHTRPYSQIYTTGNIIYIGAEMPETLEEHAQRRQFALDMMADQLPCSLIADLVDIECNMATSWGQKLAQLRLSVFDLELGELNQTVYLMGADEEETMAALFFMGDCKKNPLYTTGTGVQTGIRKVRQFDKFLGNVKAIENGEVLSEDRPQTLLQCFEKYHAKARKILDEIHAIQDDWIKGRREKAMEARANYRMYFGNKENIRSVFDCIQEVNEAATMLSRKGIPLPDFLVKAQTASNVLFGNHKKLFDCLKGEEYISSYNGIDVAQMFRDLQNAIQSIQKEYPNFQAVKKTLPKNEVVVRTMAQFYKDLEILSHMKPNLTTDKLIKSVLV